jgi:hypothetical protein
MWTSVTIVYLVAGAVLTMRLLSPEGFSHRGFVQPKLATPTARDAYRVSQSMEASISLGQ